MNERIKELEQQAMVFRAGMKILDTDKFAELIIEDACRALNPMLRDMISRGQAVDLIRQHFGVKQ